MRHDENRLATLVDTARRLVATQGQTSYEQAISALCAETMREAGFDEVHTDALHNVAGVIRGRGEGVILLDGHIDTVGVTDEANWSVPPYGGVVKDNRLYGRGASDMRGAVAAMIRAAADEARGEGGAPKRPEATIIVTCTTFEEVAEGFCLTLLLDWLEGSRGLRPDLVIIGEASGLSLNRGQRGRAALRVAAHGKAAHSSNPQHGLNAIEVMQPLLEALARRKAPAAPLLGEGSAAVTGIASRPWPAVSVVPDLCAITIDRRLLTGERREDVLAEFAALADGVTRRHPACRYTVDFERMVLPLPDGGEISRESFAPAWELPAENAFVGMGLRALAGAGLKPACGHYAFCTNGSGSCGERGIPTLGFGPSFEHLAHVADEYVDIDQLAGAYRGYRALIREFGRELGNGSGGE